MRGISDIVALTKELVAIKSIANEYESLQAALGLPLSELEEFTIERFDNKGVSSALVYTGKQRPERFKIILNAHLDVIPGRESGYTARVEDDRLFGVGAMDMKASVACFVAVFRKMAREVEYPLALQVTTDEQLGGFNGTKYQIDQGVRADFVLAGEPTNLDIVNEAKGVLWLKVSVRGKSAHGAYTWRGDNAIWKMKSFLDRLQKHFPIPKGEKWETTLNLSSIETDNSFFNKIPDACAAKLDIRYVPEEAELVLDRVKSLLPPMFELDIVAEEAPVFTDPDNEFVKLLQKAIRDSGGGKIRLRGAHGSSDARHFASVGGSGVEFGPVGDGIGGNDEWVSIGSMEKYVQILERFLRNIEEA